MARISGRSRRQTLPAAGLPHEMSFSVLPIAVIAPPFGAPSPGSDAEAGFDALLAAFTGEAAAPQGEPPKTPAADGGQAKANPPEALLVVPDEAEPPSPEGPGEDPTAGMAAAAALVAEAIVPPAPLSAPVGATASPPEAVSTGVVVVPTAYPRPPGPVTQTPAELGARLAATDEAGSTAESEPPVAAPVETSPAGAETETEAKTPQPVESARAAASLQTPAARSRPLRPVQPPNLSRSRRPNRPRRRRSPAAPAPTRPRVLASSDPRRPRPPSPTWPPRSPASCRRAAATSRSSCSPRGWVGSMFAWTSTPRAV